MNRLAKVAICLALLAVSFAAVVFWPRERLPLQIDGEQFLVNELGLVTDFSDGRDKFVFQLEHDTGFFEPERMNVQFALRIFCHIKSHPLTSEDVKNADFAEITVVNYDWKIGRLGSFQGHGFNIDVVEQDCGEAAGLDS